MDKQNDKLSEDPPENRGKGEPLVWTRTTRRDSAVELLTAYKWPISITFAIVAIVLLLGWVPIPSLDDVPPEFWSAVFYGIVGLIVGSPVAYYLYKRWHTVSGIEVWDLDPITNEHRHLRIGEELWDELIVLSPWGEPVGRQELQNCTINGRTGREMMDFRITEDGTPMAVSTFIGEANSSMLRTYRHAMLYARRRLSRKANQALMEEANREPIAREVAERVVKWQIDVANETGVPGAGEIQNVVQDVLDDMGMADPLANDDLEGIKEWQPGQQEADHDRDLSKNGDGAQLDETPRKVATNGSGPK